MNPAAPAARVRPSSVTISSNLLFLVAALQVVGLIVALSVLGTMSDVYKEAFRGTQMEDQAGTIGTVTVIATAGVGLVVAIGLMVLALLNNRGKNPARIVTWVLGGLYVCCAGFGLVSSAAGNAMNMGQSSDPNVPSQSEIQRMLEEQLPSWYTPTSTTISVVALIALLVALILLALPASNEFFRKPQVAWEPPVPGSTYPAYPQTYPGYPQTGPGYPPSGPPSQPPAPPAG
jgi:hypothetical protein